MKLNPERLQKDAEAVHKVIIDGGIAIVPLDVAYAIVGHKGTAIKKIFSAKKRSFDKPSGMFACMDHSLKIHQMGEMEREIQRTLFYEYNLPFSHQLKLVYLVTDYAEKSKVQAYQLPE